MDNNLELLWEGDRCRVFVDRRQGLRYEYVVHLADGVTCWFPLFSEVGEPYQPSFKGFFNTHEIAFGGVRYEHQPFLADRLVGLKQS